MRKIRNSRMVWYVAALTLLLLGGRGTDIGRLRPVEVVQLTEKDGLLFLETDTGDVGWGLTINQSVQKLKETTPGQIYLDTADFVLLEEGLEEYIPDLRSYLKRRTRMAYGTKGVDLPMVADYLRVHRPTGTIGNRRKPEELLSFEGGKMILKKFEEK